MKGYDKTLNPDQQKAAIAELQGEQTKHQGEGAGQDSTPEGGAPLSGTPDPIAG